MRNDGGSVDAASRFSRALLLALTGCLALFATGTGPRPWGPAWAVAYDVLLFNAVYLLGALVCLSAARRVPAERIAWSAMAIGLALAVVGNLAYSLQTVRGRVPEFPSIGDAASLLSFVPVCVALVALVRARAPRASASTWLDGISGALGCATVAVALLLGSAPHLPTGDALTVVASLAFPLVAILLVALMGVAGGVLGLRRAPGVALLVAGAVSNLAGDVAYAALAPSGAFDGGGPYDLFFVAGVALAAWGAHVTRPVPRGEQHPDLGARVGWRMVAVPLVCSAASLAVLVVDGALPTAARLCAAGCVAATLLRALTTLRELQDFHAVRDQAFTDELTGLPNRRALLERASQVVGAATAAEPAAVLLLDLDGFKSVNDTLGHHAGDELLRQVEPRLRDLLGTGDLLGRLGGDEFAVLLPGSDLDHAQARARDIRDRLLKPFRVTGVSVHVGVSIGVATVRVPAASVAEVLLGADAAMYAAKTAGGGVRAHAPAHDGPTDRRRRRADHEQPALMAHR